MTDQAQDLPPALTAALSENLANTPINWDNILSLLTNHFACVTGTIHQHQASTDNLILLSMIGVPESLIAKVSCIPMGKGMAGLAAERKQPVKVCNLQTDASGAAKPSAREAKVAGSITVPLMADDKLLGTLGLAKSEAYDFSDAELEQMMALGALFAPRLVS